MTEYDKCKDCRWHTGKMTSVGRECMQPDNQWKWNELQEIRERAGIRFRKVVTRYKPDSARACRRFERRSDE